jgi:hypothetical protein
MHARQSSSIRLYGSAKNSLFDNSRRDKTEGQAAVITIVLIY